MTVRALVEHYGYAVVFLSALIEGESMLILGAVVARMGKLSLPLLMAAAAAGAFLGDNAAFLLGRRYGPALLRRWPSLQAAVPRVDRLVARWRALAVVLLRFAYGVRLAGPVTLGAARTMPFAEFAAANAVGAILWAIAIGSVGHALGFAADRVLGQARRVEEGLLALGIAVIVASVCVHALARRPR